MFKFNKKKIAFILILLLLATLLFSAVVTGEPRDLTEDEKGRIEGAIALLKEMGEEDWSIDVQIWLDGNKIKVDPTLSANAKTSKSGNITVRGNFVKKLSKEEAKDPMKVWKDSVDLARLLVHEKVHAHYQAPNSDTFIPNGRKATDWDDSWTGYEICTGPEATEVEAYLKFIYMLMDWWEDLDQTEIPNDLTPEAKTAKEKELNDKKEYLEELIDKWLDVLKSHNYEKKDYIKDTSDAISIGEGKTKAQKMAEKKAAVKARIDGLFGEGGEYERARKAASDAKKVKEEKEPSILDQIKEVIEDISSIYVSIDPNDIDKISGVEFALFDPYVPQPPGYKYVDFSQIGAPLLSIEYIGTYESEIPFTLKLETGDLDKTSMALYKGGNTKPTNWDRVAIQELDPSTGTIYATVDGAGVYAVLTLESLFNDVPYDTEYYNYIQWMKEQEIMIGIGNGMFGYGNILTRAEFSVLLVKALALESTTDISFEDVPYDSWYYNSIAIAFKNNLISGESDYVFSPNKKLTMEQAITIIIKGAGLEENALLLDQEEVDEQLAGLDDSELISSWARPYVAEAIRSNIWIMEEDKDGNVNFGPDDSIFREKSAKMFYNLINRLN